MSQSRRLAAIMFTDIVGYTALMQTNEEEAKEKRQRHKLVFNHSVEEHRGKVLQYFGDGTLSIFSSAIDCVNCAIAIQQQLNQPPKVDVRIGIHTGDISYDDEGIYGNGVNIASRIETLSVPGGIFISDRVYEDIKNHKHILTREIGFFDMKNVQQPVHVFAIANEGLVVPNRNELRGKTIQPVNTLAVLPFVNLSNDADNEYFSDGITEELLNALTAVEGLRVTSRTSSFALKGRNEDIRDIASKLNVEKIVEGSVRKSGNRVRITAQLVNAVDGFHIWSETYDRDLTDIFRVQDEISKIIANKLRTKLSIDNRNELLVKAPVENLEAYSLFLKGKYYQNKETPAEMFKAIDYFRQSIALAPDFALPHAFIAAAYGLLGSIGIVPPQEAYHQIVENSNRALELDNSLPQGHVARGMGYLFFDWRWDDAYRSLMKAIELNPGSTEAYWVLGYYYLIVNEPANAVAALEKAWQQDPLSMSLARSLGIAYFYQKRFDDVIRLSDMQLEVMPGNWYALAIKGFAFGMLGDWHKALEILIKSNELSAGSPLTLSYLAFCYGRLKRKEKALSYTKQIESFHQLQPDLVKNGDLSFAWWGIGDREKAFDYMFKAIEQKEQMQSFMINSPLFTGLHDDVRFEEVKRKMNL
jgi:adenylate cyclase